MAIQLGGGGGKALMAWPLVEFFLRLPLDGTGRQANFLPRERERGQDHGRHLYDFSNL